MSGGYVDISGVSKETLEFFGLSLAFEDSDFALYVDRDGEEYIVDRLSPYIYFDDLNDILQISGDTVITVGSG